MHLAAMASAFGLKARLTNLISVATRTNKGATPGLNGLTINIPLKNRFHSRDPVCVKVSYCSPGPPDQPYLNDILSRAIRSLDAAELCNPSEFNVTGLADRPKAGSSLVVISQ